MNLINRKSSLVSRKPNWFSLCVVLALQHRFYSIGVEAGVIIDRELRLFREKRGNLRGAAGGRNEETNSSPLKANIKEVSEPRWDTYGTGRRQHKQTPVASNGAKYFGNCGW